MALPSVSIDSSLYSPQWKAHELITEKGVKIQVEDAVLQEYQNFYPNQQVKAQEEIWLGVQQVQLER